MSIGGLMYLCYAVANPQLGDVKVSEIMSRRVISVTPNTGIKAAATLLAEHGVSALPVLDAKDGLVGIVSEADLLPLEARPDPLSQATPVAPSAGSAPKVVADVMTREVLTVSVTSEVSQAARIMLAAGIKRVPVLQGRRVVGIVSRRDLVRVIARRDRDIETDIVQQLGQLGLPTGEGVVRVTGGVATLELDDEGPGRRLAESVALGVPGVLEVRFATVPASQRL